MVRKYVLDYVTMLLRMVKGRIQHRSDGGCHCHTGTLTVASSPFRYFPKYVPRRRLDSTNSCASGLFNRSIQITFHIGGIPVPHARVFLVWALAMHIETLIDLMVENWDRPITESQRKRNVQQRRCAASPTNPLSDASGLCSRGAVLRVTNKSSGTKDFLVAFTVFLMVASEQSC